MCFFCKGALKTGSANHFVDLESRMIIIKNIPCQKCEQCGEVVYTGYVLRRIEQITKTIKKSYTEIAIVNYTDEAA